MQCIRCGREIPEHEMFCSVCKLPPVSVPVELPEEQKPSKKELRRKAKAAAKRKHVKSASNPRVVRRLALALTAAVLLLVGIGVFLVRNYEAYQDRKNDLRIREASVALREQEADNRDARIQELEDALAKAEETISRLENELDKLSPR